MTGLLISNHEVSNVLYLVLKAAFLLGCLYVLYKTSIRLMFSYRVRTRYSDLPQMPRHWLWGNLINVGEQLNPAIYQHPDYAFEDIWRDLGQPPAYMIDLAPIDRAMLIVADPSVAEAVCQPTSEYKYSMPKSNTLEALTRLVGHHSLVLIEGGFWRTQRRRFNKGFAPAYLHTLIPLVVSKTRIFVDRLRGLAENGQTFALKDLATDLTVDVITQVAIDQDFHAQTVPEGQDAKSRFGILTSIKTMSGLVEKVGQGFDLGAYLSPQRRVKEWVYDRIYTKAIYNEIISKLPSSSNNADMKHDSHTSAKAIVSLALSGLDPTPTVLESAVSQVKTFLFAGSDTTSTVIQWMAYELSKSYASSPLYSDQAKNIREQLCAEHDAVFGIGDPFAPLDFLGRPDANVEELLGAKLPYTTAFIKETLRLHPPAGSARLIPLAPFDADYTNNKDPKPYFIDMPAWTHSKTGEHHEARKVRVDGCRMYNCHYVIHRNANVFGPDASEFNPARFLDRSGKALVDENEEAMHTGETQASSTERGKSNLPHPYHISTLPTGSFRPFERGPRNCIGSNLAYMELKIVLSIMARSFEWTKIGLNGTKPKSGDAVYGGAGKADPKLAESKGWEVWSINNVTSVPVDGMRMTVKIRR